MELATGMGVFANGGYKIQPYFIERIEDPRGNVIYTAPEVVLCDDCDPQEESPLISEMRAETLGDNGEPVVLAGVDPETGELSSDFDPRDAVTQLDVVNAPMVIEPRNAFVMNSMMRDVVRRGTAKTAGEALGRSDLGGKTGTTNNQLDAWFSGFSDDTVVAAWLGSDGLEPLGRREAGSIAALPMWTEYMQTMLDGVSEVTPEAPSGLKQMRIDWKSGKPSSGSGQSLMEFFFDDNVPHGSSAPASTSASSGGGAAVGAAGGSAGARSVTAAPTTRQDQKDAVEELF